MTERPILFSAPMVRAILEGRKTETRRIISERAAGVSDFHTCRMHGGFTLTGELEPGAFQWDCGSVFTQICCPYGKPGDRLWVREAFYAFGHWEQAPGVRTKGGRQKWRFVEDNDVITYVPPLLGYRKGRHHKDPATRAWHKRLARFMPRKYSRITLEVTDVRPQRLQDISRGACMEEGCPFPNMQSGPSPKDWYRDLWESINGPGSWNANPWVWAITFKRINT